MVRFSWVGIFFWLRLRVRLERGDGGDRMVGIEGIKEIRV